MHASNGTKMIEALRKLGKKTKSHIAKELLKDKEYEGACSLACELFYEMMDEFKEGEMTWEEAIADLYENLKAMDMPKHTKAEEEEDE